MPPGQARTTFQPDATQPCPYCTPLPGCAGTRHAAIPAAAIQPASDWVDCPTLTPQPFLYGRQLGRKQARLRAFRTAFAASLPNPHLLLALHSLLPTINITRLAAYGDNGGRIEHAERTPRYARILHTLAVLPICSNYLGRYRCNATCHRRRGELSAARTFCQ